MEESDVLIRGSVVFLGPRFRACRWDVVEKGDVGVGAMDRNEGAILCAAVGRRHFDELRGRKIGRKAERFMVGRVDVQLVFGVLMDVVSTT